MTNFSYETELPAGIFQIITPDLLRRMISWMRIGSIREISNICNVSKNTVISALEGRHRDDLIVQVTINKFAQDFENYYGEKFSLTSLAVLYE